MKTCRSSGVVYLVIAIELTLAATSRAGAQVVLNSGPSDVAPTQGYAVIGRETIPVPLLSDGSDRSFVSQTGQANKSSLNVQGYDSTTTQQQIGSLNNASAVMAGNQNTLSLIQSGNANTAGVESVNGSANRVGIQQIGNGNSSEISVVGQNNTIVSQQIGSNLSNTITEIGSGKTISVRQSR